MRRQLSFGSAARRSFPSLVAASTGGTAHTDNSGSTCTLPDGSRPSAQSFGSAARRSYRHPSLHRRGERRTWTFQAPRACCMLARGRQLSYFGSAVRRSYRHSSLHRRGERSTWTISGSTCTLPAGSRPSAQFLDRPFADRTVTRRCIDEVNGAHGQFRLHVHAAGWLEAVSSVFWIGRSPIVPSLVAASTR